MDSNDTFIIPILNNLTPFWRFGNPWARWPIILAFFSRTCQAWMGIQLVFVSLRLQIRNATKCIVLKRQNEHIYGQWWRSSYNLAQWPFAKVISCHVRSYKFFLLMTSYRNEIERCRWPHCVQLAELHRFRCILTFFGYHLTPSSRDLRSPEVKIWLTFRG